MLVSRRSDVRDTSLDASLRHPARLHNHEVRETSTGGADAHIQEMMYQMACASIAQSWSPDDLLQFQLVVDCDGFAGVHQEHKFKIVQVLENSE